VQSKIENVETRTLPVPYLCKTSCENSRYHLCEYKDNVIVGPSIEKIHEFQKKNIQLDKIENTKRALERLEAAIEKAAEVRARIGSECVPCAEAVEITTEAVNAAGKELGITVTPGMSYTDLKLKVSTDLSSIAYDAYPMVNINISKDVTKGLDDEDSIIPAKNLVSIFPFDLDTTNKLEWNFKDLMRACGGEINLYEAIWGPFL
jgi:hypothetical protein